jgi:hypothetical protein
MKRIHVAAALALGLCVAGVMNACAKDKDNDSDDKVGDTAFSAYDGSQSWPRGSGGEVNKDYSVPIYIGLPDKRFKVLGRVYDKREEGFDAVSRAFDEGLGSEKHRMRNVANQAKDHGADAVIVVEDEDVFKAFNLTKREVRDSSPLFKYKHSIVLAVKF